MAIYNLPKVFNWQKASTPIVKKYVADLYQNGVTAPVATELYNDTEVSFTYEYINPGVYAVTASKDLFTNVAGQNVQVNITNATYIDSLTGPDGASCVVFPTWSNIMIILTSDLTAEVNGILGHNTQNALEITIYP